MPIENFNYQTQKKYTRFLEFINIPNGNCAQQHSQLDLNVLFFFNNLIKFRRVV